MTREAEAMGSRGWLVDQADAMGNRGFFLVEEPIEIEVIENRQLRYLLPSQQTKFQRWLPDHGEP